MSEAKQGASKQLSKEWSQFYHALGTFNTNIVSRILKEPERLGPITDELATMACQVHAEQCLPGEIFDAPSHSCVRFRDPDEEGPVG